MVINDVKDSALDATMVSLGSKSMGGGVATSIIGYMSSSGFAVLIGVLVTILGFFCSIYFQRRRNSREREKWELEKAQMLAEENRKKELHRLRMGQLTNETSC